jgi:hypothetical protein
MARKSLPRSTSSGFERSWPTGYELIRKSTLRFIGRLQCALVRAIYISEDSDRLCSTASQRHVEKATLLTRRMTGIRKTEQGPYCTIQIHKRLYSSVSIHTPQPDQPQRALPGVPEPWAEAISDQHTTSSPSSLALTLVSSMAAVASPAAAGASGSGKDPQASSASAAALSRQIPIVCPGHTRPLAELQFCPVPASAGGDEAERCLLISACHGTCP